MLSLNTSSKNLLSNRLKYSYKKFIIQKNILLQNLKTKIEENNTFDINNYKCILCSKKEFTIFSEIDRNYFPVNFSICKECGMINSNIHFNNEFSKIYFSIYYNNFKTKNFEENFLKRISKNSFSFERYKFINKKLGNNINKIRNVFEPGCNDGCNLYPFMINKFNVFGCDYDKNSINVGNKYNLNLAHGGIETLIKLNIKADLIILSHILAHIPNLKEFIYKIKSLMHKDTIIYIETPGLLSWLQTDYKIKKYSKNYKSNNNILSFLQLDFCYIFTSYTIDNLLKKYGFIKIYSDELIRGLYQMDIFFDSNAESSISIENKYNYNLNHIQKVEDNYRSLKNIIKNMIKNFFRF